LVLLHLAFKWDVSRPSHYVVTQYHWHPGLSIDEILSRLSEIYAQAGNAASKHIAFDLVRLAESRLDGGALRYLEVSEAGNARRSYDLNLYDAGLLVEDIRPLVARMCSHYSIAWDAMEDLYNRIAHQQLGHVAGGAHRDRQDFFNIYFGAEERRSSDAAVGTSPAFGNGSTL
jgi:hypothetical protein